MFTLFSHSAVRPTSARRRDRKLAAKSTLAVETLDKRQMLTTWSVPYPPMPFGSMPKTTSAFSIPASWGMPKAGTFGSGPSAFSSSSTNTIGRGSSFLQPFSTPAKPTYSTSSFFNTSSYFTPSLSTFGTSSFSTPTFSSHSPYGSSIGSSNVYTTRPGSAYFGTSAPVIFSTTGGGATSSYVNSLANLQSSVNQLQHLNSQLVAMGGTPVGIPSSVTSVLNRNIGSGSSWESPAPRTYSQAEAAAMMTGGSRIVLAKPGYSGLDRVTDRGDMMLKTAQGNQFGKGGMVDSVKRTANVINRVIQPVAKLVQPLSSLAARAGGGFVGTAARRR